MTAQDLTRYNRRLGDARGRNPHGDPVYRWHHSKDLALRYPVRNGDGSYENLRQIDEDRWLIAMWYPPCDEDDWKRQFPDLGYPAEGMYYATDVMLLPGIEPNDTITEDVIGKLKTREGWTFRDHLDEIEGRRTKREKALAAKRSDIIDDAATAFGNIPGCRGGTVSFGGFDIPLIKKN